MAYAESDLVIPALEALRENAAGLRTEDLIKILTERLEPAGRDSEILSGRRDTYFSQKVRNLKSHNTLERRGLATYDKGVFHITEEGKQYAISGIGEIAQALQDQGFSEDERKEAYEQDYGGILVEEGRVSYRNQRIRQRSSFLTEIARKRFLDIHGKLRCAGCDFDFEEQYDGRGKGYIEIHHLKPIHEHDIEGEKQIAEKALEKLVPLCSNCHRMIHRERDNLLSLEELRELIQRSVVEASEQARSNTEQAS